MKIIKNGDINLLDKTRIFTCDRCKCVFEATKDEYQAVTAEYQSIDYICNCPTCNEKVYNSRLKNQVPQSQLEALGY